MTDVSRVNPTRGLAAGLGISSSVGTCDGPENAALDQFRAAIAEAGLAPPEFITADGKLHRFSSDGWRADIGRELTADEIAAHKRKMTDAKRKQEEEEKKNRAKARTRAAKIWESAAAAPADHAYLAKKGIGPHGLRIHCGELVVPLRDTSRVCCIACNSSRPTAPKIISSAAG